MITEGKYIVEFNKFLGEWMAEYVFTDGKYFEITGYGNTVQSALDNLNKYIDEDEDTITIKLNVDTTDATDKLDMILSQLQEISNKYDELDRYVTPRYTPYYYGNTGY